MPKQTIPPDLQSQKLVLDSLILEYKNTFERSDKLDNKVYIVITFCGFVFVFITNLFGGLTGLVMPEGTLALLLTVLYVGSCLAVMLAYVLVPTLLPLTLDSFHAAGALIGLVVGSIPAAMNFVMNPILSTTSDRTRTKWGRRTSPS